MKLDTIMHAVRYCALNDDTLDKARIDDLLDTLNRCASLRERYSLHEAWEDEVCLLAMPVVDEMMTTLLYDAYGTLARKYNATDRLPLSIFSDHVRKHALLNGDQLTTYVLSFAHEIISNLWHENEQEPGTHNADGSYKQPTHPAFTEQEAEAIWRAATTTLLRGSTDDEYMDNLTSALDKVTVPDA